MNSKSKSISILPNVSFQRLEDAHGAIPYGMANDYMFRAVLQSNNKVLRGIICSLLHLSESEIISTEIINPIILGQSIEDKEFLLDISILLNNHTIINLEMQVANKLNWPNRSILYLCRSFDNPKRGQDYQEAIPAIHIGFLDYTLFKECPEFYATYKLINVKNHHIYSDNFILSVIDLSKIDLATEEDRKYHIDYWVSLFKASTWEDIRMLASKNEYLNEASKTIFQLSADEQIRKRCRDWEEYYQDLRNYEREIEKMRTAISVKDAAISEKDTAILEKDAVILEKNAVILEKNAAISEKDAAILEKDSIIEKLLAEIRELKN